MRLPSPVARTVESRGADALTRRSFVTAYITLAQPGDKKGGYFDATLTDIVPPAVPEGDYRAWCVDPSHTAVTAMTKVDLISTYSSKVTFLETLVGEYCNLDALNYVLNVDWKSRLGLQSAPTTNDIQATIWHVIDLNNMDQALAGITYDADLVARMVHVALYEDGQDYKPPVGGVLAVIADPTRYLPAGAPRAQLVVVELPVGPGGYGDKETAWGYGLRADAYVGPGIPYSEAINPNGQWGMYFEFFYSEPHPSN